ncbi:type 2 periplasmic-binding domain-containing protein [Actinophytocola algeriensis]|uniref:Uncharacterized protein n=1 Tax=Actinophytocola algeriensis TaxID=1768010 RepID=A0A7W7Q5P9_9PSEU|nr:hypothetical protein [Actinophytocola algeriensis]MBB4907464.1 hypothetical protein [Actinophytocola algeriensis]MBE1479494.1 hypothetical protein [Actinophytocola algeriensis]
MPDRVGAVPAPGAGLAVVPRRAVDPGQTLDVCDLQDTWARRDQLLAWGATSRTDATEALAEHLRRAAGTGTGLAVRG